MTWYKTVRKVNLEAVDSGLVKNKSEITVIFWAVDMTRFKTETNHLEAVDVTWWSTEWNLGHLFGHMSWPLKDQVFLPMKRATQTHLSLLPDFEGEAFDSDLDLDFDLDLEEDLDRELLVWDRDRERFLLRDLDLLYPRDLDLDLFLYSVRDRPQDAVIRSLSYRPILGWSLYRPGRSLNSCVLLSYDLDLDLRSRLKRFLLSLLLRADLEEDRDRDLDLERPDFCLRCDGRPLFLL